MSSARATRFNLRREQSPNLMSLREAPAFSPPLSEAASYVAMRIHGKALVDVWLVRVGTEGDLVPADRDAIAHGALRRLVAQRAGIGADSVSVGHDPSGRPILVNTPLHVSLSGSGDFVACAVSNRHVGVDVERADRIEADDALAARICSREERAHLASFEDEAVRRRGLILLWTRKEAVSKVLGLGLRLPFDQVDVGGDVPRIAGRRERSLWIRDIEGGPPDYLLAVAGEGRLRPTVRSSLMLNGPSTPLGSEAAGRGTPT